jgi:hypothetical protein
MATDRSAKMAAPQPRQADLSDPALVRAAVEDYLVRKAAAEKQAAEDARIAAEEAIAAERRAAKSAPHMGHMANVTGNFRRAEHPRLTAVISTPEQRHFEATRQARLREARYGNVVSPRPD